MRVAPASVLPPLRLVPDVLRDKNLVGEAEFHEIHYLVDADMVVRQVYLALLDRVVALAPEQVVLHVDARPCDCNPVVPVAHGTVDVVDCCPAEVRPGFFHHLDGLHRGVLVLAWMDVEGGARLLLRPGGGPERLMLPVGQRPCAADLADESGADASGADALVNVAHNVLDYLVLALGIHVRRKR